MKITKINQKETRDGPFFIVYKAVSTFIQQNNMRQLSMLSLHPLVLFHFNKYNSHRYGYKDPICYKRALIGGRIAEQPKATQASKAINIGPPWRGKNSVQKR